MTLRKAFCTEFSQEAREPLDGWGAHKAQNIFIRWPKAQWGYSMRLTFGMGPKLGEAIDRVFATGWRINLIDRKPYDSDLIRVYLMPDAVECDLAPEELIPFLDAFPEGRNGWRHFRPRKVSGSLILCCTHGKHDRCCAKFGFAAYKAIARAADGLVDVSVWEATQLGGCRLSATVLTLPQMHKYGRVCPKDVDGLIAATRDGIPYLPCYRGASHLSPPAQAAEIAARQVLSERGLIAPLQIEELSQSTNEALFWITAGDSEFKIRCVSYVVESYGSCADMGTEPGPAAKRVWDAEILQCEVK